MKEYLSASNNETRPITRTLQTLLIISITGLTGAAGLSFASGYNQLVPPIIIMLIFLIVSFFLLRRGVLFPAQILLPTTLFLLITYLVAGPSGYGLHDINLIGYSAVILLAGLTLGQTALFGFAALIILAIFGIGFSEMLGYIVSPTSKLTSLVSPFNLSLVTLAIASIQNTLINLLNENIRRVQASEKETMARNAELQAFSKGLENIVKDRTAELVASNQRNESRAKQFEAISQVARSISSTQNFDVLLPQITNLISREFGFYHVGVFLLDPRKEYAVLSASNSEGGQRMLERNHRLKVGETGLVGYVTSSGKARLALDTGTDAVFFNNPDLPETRSEIALPLLVGNQIIGALDVQSNQPNAFDQEDINILSTLADQVSIAIQNARQYEETRRALTESESLSRQFVQTGWQQFTKSQNLVGIRHTGAKATLLYTKNRKNKVEDENASNRDQARAKTRGASLSLPVKLRGEVIGSVDVRSPANRQFDQDELDIVTAIIERAAIAMENARLLAESQKRAAKERTIGEITAKISAQSDIDELLKTAAQELNRTLPGMEIAIQLKKEDVE